MPRFIRRAACLFLSLAWYRVAGLHSGLIVRSRLNSFKSVSDALMPLSELLMYGVMSRSGLMLFSPVVVVLLLFARMGSHAPC